MNGGSFFRGRRMTYDPRQQAAAREHQWVTDDAIRRRNGQLDAIAMMELEFAGDLSEKYERALEDYVRTGRAEDLDRMLQYVKADS